MRTIIETARKILFKPKKFFDEDAKKIKGWKQPVTYLVVFTLFSTLFITFSHLHNTQTFIWWLEEVLKINSPFHQVKLTFKHFLSTYILLSVLMIIGSFFRYICTHAIIKLWNKKAVFDDSYKALSFSTTPGWLATPFFVIFSFMLYFGLKSIRPFWWWALLGLSFTIGIVLQTYAMYLRSYGLAKLQDVKIWQAFLAIYIFGLILYFLLVFIVELIVLFILFGLFYLF